MSKVYHISCGECGHSTNGDSPYFRCPICKEEKNIFLDTSVKFEKEESEEQADKMIFECVGALYIWLTGNDVSKKEAREILHHNVNRVIDKIESNN